MTHTDLKAHGLSQWDNEGGAPASGDRSTVERHVLEQTKPPRVPKPIVDRTKAMIALKPFKVV